MPKPSTKYTNEIFIRPRDIVVIDYLRYRRSSTVRQAFRVPGLFLPECPLDLNRIEMLFAKLKTASTPPNLPEQAIDDALELLSDLSSNAPTTAHTPDMLESRIAGCQSAIGSARD